MHDDVRYIYIYVSSVAHTEHRTIRILIAPVHVYFVCKHVLTKDTFESKTIHFLWIEWNLVRFGKNIRICVHVLRIVSVFLGRWPKQGAPCWNMAKARWRVETSPKRVRLRPNRATWLVEIGLHLPLATFSDCIPCRGHSARKSTLFGHRWTLVWPDFWHSMSYVIGHSLILQYSSEASF